MMALPRFELICALPPEPTTTYCLPPTYRKTGGALTPAPVWNCQSTLPLAVSYALNQPLASPVKTRPPAVDENAADHRLRRLDLPDDLPGVVVDRSDIAESRLSRDFREGAAEPQFSIRIGCVGDGIGHRLMQVNRESHVVIRIGRDRRPFDASVGARVHAGRVGVKRLGRRRQRPPIILDPPSGPRT